MAAPLASRLMADLGADVIKVEPPTGDFSRYWDRAASGGSSYFAWANRRKRSIALNLRSPDDAHVLHQVLGLSDVLICNMQYSAAERAGLTEARLSELYPHLVVCQITGYGISTSARDRKAYDTLMQAETGLISLTGSPTQAARIGVPLCDIGTGLQAVILILAAIIERERSGLGRYIDLSMFEAMGEFTGPDLTAFANSGVAYQRNPLRHNRIVPYGIFVCRDGQITFAVEHDSEWRSFCQGVLNRPELSHDPRFATNGLRVAGRSDLEALIELAMVEMPVDEVVRRLSAAGIAYGVINEIGDAWSHPTSTELGLQSTAVLPDGTVVRLPQSAAERTFDRRSPAAIPGLDQHREEIMAELWAAAVLDG